MVEGTAETIGHITVRGGLERTDEAALIRSAQAGDKDAFERLVRSYDQGVLRMAMNLLRSRKTPETSIRKRFCGFTGISRSSDSIAAFIRGSTASLQIFVWIRFVSERSAKEESASVSTGAGDVDRFQFVAEERADVDPQRHLLSAEVNSRIQEVWNA